MPSNRIIPMIENECSPLRIYWQSFFMASFMTFLFSTVTFIPIFLLYVLFYTKYYFTVLLYICWCIWDKDTPHDGGRKREFMNNWKLLHTIGEYFPVRLVKTADIQGGRNYMFACYPHGLFCYGISCNFIIGQNYKGKFPLLDPYVIALNACFNIPILREFLLWCGLCASSERGILKILNSDKKNKIVIINVGGAAEAVISQPATHRIILKNRKGFIRLSLKAGVPLVPVYTFGENDVYDQIRGKYWTKLQNFIRQWIGIPPAKPLGTNVIFSIGQLPKRIPITTVVGRPILLPKFENPSQELIEEYHKKFRTELKKLFNSEKSKYDILGDKAELIIE